MHDAQCTTGFFHVRILCRDCLSAVQSAHDGDYITLASATCSKYIYKHPCLGSVLIRLRFHSSEREFLTSMPLRMADSNSPPAANRVSNCVSKRVPTARRNCPMRSMEIRQASERTSTKSAPCWGVMCQHLNGSGSATFMCMWLLIE